MSETRYYQAFYMPSSAYWSVRDNTLRFHCNENPLGEIREMKTRKYPSPEHPEITAEQAHVIGSGWNLSTKPSPTPDAREGAVAKLAKLVEALENIAKVSAPLPPGYGNESGFAGIHAIATSALTEYKHLNP